jgi:type II secretory pathway pseudopilin PulG
MVAMRRRQAGFTYIGLLFAIAILGITLAAVGVVWSTQIRRDKEMELLYAGDQIRDAIGHYRAAGGQYPQALTDLLQDNRTPVPRHFLRRLYLDPMTNSSDWELIMAPEGGILGVASRSQEKPIKVEGFSGRDASFARAETYSQWRFIYSPRAGPRRRVIRSAPAP